MSGIGGFQFDAQGNLKVGGIGGGAPVDSGGSPVPNVVPQFSQVTKLTLAGVDVSIVQPLANFKYVLRAISIGVGGNSTASVAGESRLICPTTGGTFQVETWVPTAPVVGGFLLLNLTDIYIQSSPPTAGQGLNARILAGSTSFVNGGFIVHTFYNYVA